MPNAHQNQKRALRADSCAPATSPAAYFEFTCEANTMDAIPKGRQQHSVTKMACTKKLSGAGKAYPTDLGAGLAGGVTDAAGALVAGMGKPVGSLDLSMRSFFSKLTPALDGAASVKNTPHFQQNLLSSLFSVPQLGQNIVHSPSIQTDRPYCPRQEAGKYFLGMVPAVQVQFVISPLDTEGTNKIVFPFMSEPGKSDVISMSCSSLMAKK